MPTAVLLFALIPTLASAILRSIPDIALNQSIVTPLAMQTNVTKTLTFAYDLATAPNQDYINVYFEPRINSHQGQPGPNYSSVVYMYAQVMFNGTGASSLHTFDTIQSIMIDGNGYVMMKNQLLSISRNANTPALTTGNMTVTVFLADSEPNAQVDAQFNLTINTSMPKPCPNNCSGKGVCNAGTCDCSEEDRGYDCSVQQEVLSLKVNSGLYLKSGQLAYAVAPSELTSSVFWLNIAKPTDKECDVVFRMNEKSKFSVMSIHEGSGKDLVSSSYQSTYKVLPFDGKLYIVLQNYGPEDCQVTISISEQAAVSILLIIMIVLGVAILIALIIGIIYIVRKRREFRVQPRESLARGQAADTNLTPLQIERYFPVVLADKVMTARSRNESSMDLIPTQDCVICLCPIERTEFIRITYCNHLFHKDCLLGWFKKLQNCPYCRQSFNKDSIEELFGKIKKFATGSTSNSSIALQGTELAIQIVEYHRSTKSIGSQQELIGGKSPNNRLNIQNLE